MVKPHLGPQLKLPGLQRAASRACVSCGGAADAYCARCGVTPYCSPRCQRRDWLERHAAVCHNLARLNRPLDVEDDIDDPVPGPAPAPLRRPRSPPPPRDDSSERGSGKKCLPPGNFPKHQPRNNSRDDNRSGRDDNRSGRDDSRFGREDDRCSRDDNRIRRDDSRYIRDDNRYGRDDNRNGRDDNRYGRDDNRNGRDDNRYGRDDRSPQRQGGRQAGARQYDRPPRNFDKDAVKNLRRPMAVEDEACRGNDGQPNKRQGQNQQWQRRFNYTDRRQNCGTSYDSPDDESWDFLKQSPKPTPVPKEEPKASPARSTTMPTNQKAARQTPANQSSAKPAATNQGAAKQTVANQLAKSPAANQGKAANEKLPGEVSDVTPSSKLVPKNCVIETLSIGDTALLSVESRASECRTAGAGFVCLSLHEGCEAQYQALCEQYHAQAEPGYQPAPGETFSQWSPEDGGWYRARCLGKDCALLDAAKVVAVGDKIARLPADMAAIPEFCCMLQADVQFGESLQATLLEKTPRGFKVSLQTVEGAPRGEGEVSRWLPTVTPPAAAAPAATTAKGTPVPSVPRPDIVNNSRMCIVHVGEQNAKADTAGVEVYLRPADCAAFDAVLHDAALYGLSATPLSGPATVGQYVVSKYSDGLHYRALVQRTNVRQNKYLLEYLEYGNVQVNQLENLYPCPASLLPAASPVLTSRGKLHDVTHAPTQPALDYLDLVKDNATELIVTLPNGEKSAPSGASVVLKSADTKENINRRVEEISTPDWERIARRGGDALEMERVMYSELEYLELPEAAAELAVLDFSGLAGGTLSACCNSEPHLRHLAHVRGALTRQINEYCESEIGREPYLPAVEELCIARMEPYPQWFRAVLLEQVSGAGGIACEVCYVDYGNVERAPTAALRKMPRDLAAPPAPANTLEIADFPKDPTSEMLAAAIQYLKIDSEGQGVLKVESCVKEAPGMYVVTAPGLIKAMLAAQ